MKIVATYAELELLGSVYCIDSYRLSFIHVVAKPTKKKLLRISELNRFFSPGGPPLGPPPPPHGSMLQHPPPNIGVGPTGGAVTSANNNSSVAPSPVLFGVQHGGGGGHHQLHNPTPIHPIIGRPPTSQQQLPSAGPAGLPFLPARATFPQNLQSQVETSQPPPPPSASTPSR